MRLYSLLLSAALGLLQLPNPVTAQTWKELVASADSLNAQDRTDSASVLGLHALELAENEYGAIDTNVASVLFKLGEYNNKGARRRQGEEYFARCLEIRETLLPRNHIDIGRAMTRLGRLIVDRDSKEAEEVLKKALDIIQQASEVDYLNLGLAHSNLGACQLNLEKVAEARAHFEAALEAYRQVSPDCDAISGAYVRLGIVTFYLGSYDESERYFREAIAFQEKYPEPSYLGLGSLLSNFGTMLHKINKPGEAEPIMKRAVAIFEAAKDTGWLLLNVINLSNVYLSLNDFQKSEETLKHALHIIEQAGYAYRKNTILAITSLGNLYTRWNRFFAAESVFMRGRELCEEFYGPNSLETISLYANMIPLYRSTGKSEFAIDAAKHILKARRELFLLNLPGLSEKEALSYSQSMRSSLDELLSSFFDSGKISDSACASAANAIVQVKGQAIDATTQLRHFAVVNQDSVLRENLEAYRNIKLDVANAYARQSPRKDADSLYGLLRRTETQLYQAIPGFKVFYESRDLTLGQIAAAIPHNATVVEFLKYNYHIARADSVVSSYLALQLDQSRKPVIHNLGDAARIESVITMYRTHQLAVNKHAYVPTGRDLQEYNRISRRLYLLVVKPIEHLLSEGTTLFIAPDGGLNLISFAGLMNEKGKYLIEEHPIHYLSAGKDLIRIGQDSMQSGEGLLVFGDPDYDATAVQRIANENVLAHGIPTDEVASARNVRSGCVALSEINVKRLPETKTEVSAILDHFPFSNVFEGRAASEENFKTNAAGRKAIHLATHGYFLSGECQEKRERADTFVDENPLLQSGLLLAGANLHGKDADSLGAEDGILTALEVSAMDLRGTDLVVLSACETGLGKVEQGEGVYGLRRAFQMAGVKTVVSSLWKVPDKEAMQFMKTLYSTKAKTYPELMQQVALKRIREARLRGRPTHPYTWGAFVATGEWRID